MSFVTAEFFIFFLLVVVAYYAIATRFRWLLLLLASYYFYMRWNAIYIVLIIASTFVDYVAGLLIARTRSLLWKRCLLATSIFCNLGILFSFKYYNFFQESLDYLTNGSAWSLHMPSLDVLLPVGISFYTFQSMAYTIDVYRGKIQPEIHPGRFALYVSFFPQLVAGPIERASNLLPQFRQDARFDYDRTISGLYRIGWGVVKKVLIADRLAMLVNTVYSDPTNFNGSTFVLATVFFAFQIYCDFSAYSDIAIGASRILGIRLMENFNNPYHANSVGDFWRRWHISLSGWFRDYVYIPLGGSRARMPRWYANLVVTFLISGLWHGANWTFVVWGGLHSIYMIAEHQLAKPWDALCRSLTLQPESKLRRGIEVAVTFSLVCLAWIPFRANSMTDAWYIVTNLTTGWGFQTLLETSIHELGMRRTDFVIALLLIVILESNNYWNANTNLWEQFRARPIWQRWAVYYATIWVVFFYGVFGEQDFIYFQF